LKTHVEIRIRFEFKDGETLHTVLREFAAKREGWIYPAKESQEYEVSHGLPAGYVVCKSVEGLKPAAVAIASLSAKKPSCFDVPNIVPVETGSLTLGEYNAIGKAFAENIRHFLRDGPFRGEVEVSSAEKGLAEIIPAEKCRKFFEAYLRRPTSHPLDIERLDVFICALFRHRAKVNTHEIWAHLVEDLGWDRERASWVKERIDTGLDVLAIDRKF